MRQRRISGGHITLLERPGVMTLVFEGPCTLLGAHYIMWVVWHFVHSFERARPACGKQLSRSLVLALRVLVSYTLSLNGIVHERTTDCWLCYL